MGRHWEREVGRHWEREIGRHWDGEMGRHWEREIGRHSSTHMIHASFDSHSIINMCVGLGDIRIWYHHKCVSDMMGRIFKWTQIYGGDISAITSSTTVTPLSI